MYLAFSNFGKVFGKCFLENVNRQKLFRHKHEIETGRTSSVGNEILGFDSNGKVHIYL